MIWKILSLIRPWMIGGLTVGVVVGLVYNIGFNAGKNRTLVEQEEIISELRDNSRQLANELEEVRAEKQLVNKDEIRTFYIEPDPSGCADVPVPDGVLNALGHSTD